MTASGILVMRTQIKKFSLIELLVMISIILILAALLLPTLNSAYKSAQAIACASNMRQALAGLIMYMNSYDKVSTQSWSDNLIRTGFIQESQLSSLRCPSWTRSHDTCKNVFGMRRITGDAHTMRITGSYSNYVLIADSLNLDTFQQFINFYGNHGPYKLVVHYRHNRKANVGFLDGSVRRCVKEELAEKGCPRYAY